MGDRVSYLNLQTGEEIFTSKLWDRSSRVITKTIHAIFLTTLGSVTNSRGAEKFSEHYQ